jgi:hypothetical protein
MMGAKKDLERQVIAELCDMLAYLALEKGGVLRFPNRKDFQEAIKDLHLRAILLPDTGLEITVETFVAGKCIKHYGFLGGKHGDVPRRM